MVEKYLGIPSDYYEKAHYNSTKPQEFMYISRENYFIEFMGLNGIL